jgi:formamidopyrimidine-DNA glycosylase
MPELPEVETTRRGISPHIEYKTISDVIVRHTQLRWPVPEDLAIKLTHQQIIRVKRRAKYLLLSTDSGTLIIHLGMSGSLRILKTPKAAQKHDHIDIVFADKTILRFNDPRRFGAVLWHEGEILTHQLLARLGPEPLSNSFCGEHLYHLSRQRKSTIKSFIMDGHIVVGVGNIYANEALFIAGIHPARQAGRVSLQRYQHLAEAIKQVLQRAIEMGGTTLRDFVNEQGQPGYFQQTLLAYGRAGEPCRQCLTPLKLLKIAQRASYYCPHCQT